MKKILTDKILSRIFSAALIASVIFFSRAAFLFQRSGENQISVENKIINLAFEGLLINKALADVPSSGGCAGCAGGCTSGCGGSGSCGCE